MGLLDEFYCPRNVEPILRLYNRAEPTAAKARYGLERLAFVELFPVWLQKRIPLIQLCTRQRDERAALRFDNIYAHFRILCPHSGPCNSEHRLSQKTAGRLNFAQQRN